MLRFVLYCNNDALYFHMFICYYSYIIVIDGLEKKLLDFSVMKWFDFYLHSRLLWSLKGSIGSNTDMFITLHLCVWWTREKIAEFQSLTLTGLIFTFIKGYVGNSFITNRSLNLFHFDFKNTTLRLIIHRITSKFIKKSWKAKDWDPCISFLDSWY